MLFHSPLSLWERVRVRAFAHRDFVFLLKTVNGIKLFGSSVHLLNYLKTAFMNRWNLLAFLGCSAFAILSARPDVLLPLVLAGETAYIGLLGTHPKFRQYVDAQAAKAAREANSVSSQNALAYILRSLPKELLGRFNSLRNQCLELRHIALELKSPGKGASEEPMDDFQISGLDRLLWIHLRLLYTQYSLARFLQKTGAEQIDKDIQRLEKQLAQLPPGGDDPQAQRVRKALEDNLETSRARQANLAKARDNYQLVQLEIDRLENKIRSLSEMAVNRQEPDFISSQVDQVASGMVETEKTMSELQFATGLVDSLDDHAPELLRSKVAQVQKG
jgi:hypothetical protein